LYSSGALGGARDEGEQERKMRADGNAPRLYTAEQVRALDRAAIEGQGIPGIVLMKRAGRAVFRVLNERYAGCVPVHVFCGTGNNGGDGFVVAKLALERGLSVRVCIVGDRARIGGDARLAMEAALAAGVQMHDFDASQRPADGVVVDALLGTGLQGEVRAQFASAIAVINASGLPVIAVDIPSGLCSDSGRILGIAVRADHSVTFIGRKRGLFTGEAGDCCGSIHFDDLDVPACIFGEVPASAELLQIDALLAGLGPRARSAHKGKFGHVLVIGGDHGMAGAAAMAAEAAARTGAGLVSLATRAENVPAVVARCPEVMARGVGYAHELEPLLARATVIVAGPGLGQGAWARQLLQKALGAGLPLVLDADGLNLLAAMELQELPGRENWIISPHPGEAARLLGTGVAEINRDRFAALEALYEKVPGAVVLKGSGTLVIGSDRTQRTVGICPYGNPGMASGGMGDVLSGILGGLRAQGLGSGDAARLGVCLHARAADLAARGDGERGLLATDLLPWLRRLLNARHGAGS